MNSIWNNPFYQEQPALAWLYKLDLSSFYTGQIDKVNILEQAIVSLSIGKRANNYTDVFYGGVNRKIFTRTETAGEFTLQFNEDKYYSVSTVLENIQYKFNMNQFYTRSTGDTAYNYNSNFPDDQRKIVVNVYDPRHISGIDNPEYLLSKGEDGLEYPLLRWEFYGCQLVSLSEMPMSYESTETIKRDAIFCYQYMIFKNRNTLMEENNAALATKDQERQEFVNQQSQANRENYDKLYPDNNGNPMNQTMYGGYGGNNRAMATGPRTSGPHM